MLPGTADWVFSPTLMFMLLMLRTDHIARFILWGFRVQPWCSRGFIIHDQLIAHLDSVDFPAIRLKLSFVIALLSISEVSNGCTIVRTKPCGISQSFLVMVILRYAMRA